MAQGSLMGENLSMALIWHIGPGPDLTWIGLGPSPDFTHGPRLTHRIMSLALRTWKFGWRESVAVWIAISPLPSNFGPVGNFGLQPKVEYIKTKVIIMPNLKVFQQERRLLKGGGRNEVMFSISVIPWTFHSLFQCNGHALAF